jgi:CheY-like chemotaxis protein
VQLHGGRIEAHSKGLGLGSQFTVRLPLVAGAQPALVPAKPRRAAKHKLPRRVVLVVDDTRDSAFILSRLLGILGQRVITANSGESALDAARRERPDVVISDIAMPTMDGYELARRLRRETGLERVILVALTGFGQDSDRSRAYEAGFDHHVVKPVSLETLEALLASLPAPRRSRAR